MPSLPGAEFLFALSRLALTSSSVIGLSSLALSPSVNTSSTPSRSSFWALGSREATLSRRARASPWRMETHPWWPSTSSPWWFLSLRIEALFLLDWSFSWWTMRVCSLSSTSLMFAWRKTSFALFSNQEVILSWASLSWGRDFRSPERRRSLIRGELGGS